MTALLDCTTLAEVLRHRGACEPERHAYTFLKDGETEHARLSFGELDRRARAVAAALQARGAEGELAVLLYSPGLDFVAALFGCWYAGVVAIPAYPPLRAGATARFQSIVGDSRPRFALTSADVLDDARLAELRDASSCEWLATDTISADTADAWRDKGVGSERLALLQYTSGSTASPKGVMVSHANLIANERMIERAMGHSSSSTFVTWLPIYHDMGLIGNLLQPVYIGASCYLMSPVAFLQEPLRWLRAISTYRAHTSGAPDFAYDLCVQKITAEQRATLDLSSWEVAYDGSEPVRRETLERFAETFASCGLRASALYPCYGLAEATLLVTGGEKQETPRARSFDANALMADRVVDLADGADGARALIGCGRTILDQEIRIVHPETRLVCEASRIGEVWVRGPNVGQGYWNRPDTTEAMFRARVADTGDGPYLRTGDLGFLRDGELFVTGRLKDLIIVRGKNHYPQDIEQTVESSHASLRRGGCAAFPVDVDGAERLVVVAEVDRQHLRRLDGAAVIERIRQEISAHHELALHAAVLIKPGALPLTSSGKRQRHVARQRFIDAALEALV
ncbi:MAG: fatty acyl-AMP ligase, partial [Gemmatimonadaceae bacterium]